MQTTIHNLSSVPCGALCILVFVSLCGNTQSLDTAIELECTNANGNMKQMTKLSMFIFTLLPWTDYSCEFITKNIKKCLKIVKYFKMYLKINKKEMHH